MELRKKILDGWLFKNNLVAVPQEWQKEYVKLAGEKVKHLQALQDLMEEYNKLLEDYYNKCSIKELKEVLKAAGLNDAINRLSKEALVELAIKEYKMYYKKD